MLGRKVETKLVATIWASIQPLYFRVPTGTYHSVYIEQRMSDAAFKIVPTYKGPRLSKKTRTLRTRGYAIELERDNTHKDTKALTRACVVFARMKYTNPAAYL